MEEGELDEDQFVDTNYETPEEDVLLESEEVIRIRAEELEAALLKDQIIVPVGTINQAYEPSSFTPPAKKKKVACEMCQQQEAKYCCPQCKIQTCCLECVKQHKVNTGCTGKKSSEYLHVTQMDDNMLRSDYFFLKEGERLAGESYRVSTRQSKKAKRAQSNKRSNTNAEKEKTEGETEDKDDNNQKGWGSHTVLPMALRKLVTEASNRGVTLKLMPRGMTRRKQNTTFYAYRTQKFYWRIEWVLNEFLGENNLLHLSSERVDDTTLLKDSLLAMFNSFRSKANEVESAQLNSEQRKILREKTSSYDSVPIEQMVVLLPILNVPANVKQFSKLDVNASISDNLKGKSLLEFPSFFVIPPNLADSYDIQPDAPIVGL